MEIRSDNLGDPIREIDVQPIEIPDPTFVPQEEPREPVKV